MLASRKKVHPRKRSLEQRLVSLLADYSKDRIVMLVDGSGVHVWVDNVASYAEARTVDAALRLLCKENDV